jgi:NAD(P)-dependent dehydrogenase (short-subunit alcohol dehydrogenase family)
MANPFGYEGKRVVVTGGSSGLGAALVRLLADLGAASITVLDRQEPVEPIPADRVVSVDLSDPTAIDRVADELRGSIDVLFNNAGVAANLPPATVIAVNCLAPRRLTRSLLPGMTPGSAVVNTASMAGNGYRDNLAVIDELLAIEDWAKTIAWVEEHDLPTDAYTFSKQVAQVITLRESGEAAAHGVRLNAACPGIIATPLLTDFRATMTDKVVDWQLSQVGGRPATAGEIAHVLAFLGSDASSYMNGTNLIADNGFQAGLDSGRLDFSGLA